ncbi:MAG: hypothetical protein QT03_C0001G1343 [archaeon GW2011_AR10]|uniref:Uncharacterized protein n=1 Tax=Candidatus Iainarchaeum sp. TaxID=3101447 RepID=A0A7J4IVR4_9ARCH|nr:MAG: hypothetical protein QT03_C0001G1343 [archaeon GW2011_AR10]HIH08900.1 hypothetical protein [Candidatus Diapherotrites archaeon]
MDRNKFLKDSIKKLLYLSVSDEEIVKNLSEVGVERQLAEQLLAESKKEIAVGEEKEPKPKRKEDKKAIGSELSEAIPSPAASTSVDLTDLWRKGVLVTVDAKLAEMQKLKEKVEEKISSSVKKELEKEMKKFGVVVESQRVLVREKISSDVNAKINEFNSVIEAKVSDLKDESNVIQQQLAKVEALRKKNEGLVEEFNNAKSELEQLKSRLISQVSSSLIQQRSETEKFLQESEQKRKDVDARINRTLELESKIAEGLIKDVNRKVEEISLKEDKKLEGELKARIAELDSLIQQSHPETLKEIIGLMTKKIELIDQKLVELDQKPLLVKDEIKKIQLLELQKFKAFEKSLQEQMEKQVNYYLDEKYVEWSKNFNQKLAEMDQSQAELTKKAQKQVDDINKLKKQVDLDTIKATMEGLDLFKQQFINTVQKNVQEFNKAKTELAELIQKREAMVDEHIKAVDMKLEELDKFEKRFAEEMGLSIDTLTEKRSAKKAKK